jgi:hypothetical protein
MFAEKSTQKSTRVIPENITTRRSSREASRGTVCVTFYPIIRWLNPIDLLDRRWKGRMTNNTKMLDNRKLMNRQEHVTFGMRSSLMYEALQINKIPRKIGLNIIKSNMVPAFPDQPHNINNSCNNKNTHLRIGVLKSKSIQIKTANRSKKAENRKKSNIF